MKSNQEYAGYPNYHTWLLALNLNNDQGLQESVFEFFRDMDKLLVPKDTYEQAKEFKDWLEELFFVQEYGIVHICDTWDTRSWHDIDFAHLVELFREDLDDIDGHDPDNIREQEFSIPFNKRELEIIYNLLELESIETCDMTDFDKRELTLIMVKLERYFKP